MASLLATVVAHWRDPLYRNGYFLMLNSATGAAFGFAFWIIVARVFHGEEAAVGYGAAVVSAMTLAALVGKFGVDAALIRFAPRLAPPHRRRLLAFALALVAATSLAAAVAFLAVVPRIVHEFRGLTGDPIAGAVFLVAAVAIALAWVLDGFFVAERRASFTFARNVVFNAVKVLLPLLAVFHASALGIPAAWATGVIASVAVAALLVPVALRRAASGPPAEPPARPAFLRYASINAANNVADFLPGLALPILVLHVLGPEANAFFYIAWSVAFVAFLASKSIAQSTFAEMTHDEERVRHHLKKAVFQNVLVLSPFVVGALALGRFVLGLFGESYARAAYPLLVVLALSSVLVAVNALYVTLLKARRANAELVFLPVATVALTFALGYPLLASAGIVGLGVGWGLANLGVALYSGWRLVTISRRYENPNDSPIAGPASVRDPAHQG